MPFIEPYLEQAPSILYFHRALNKVTQSANQHMHTFNFFIFYIL